MPERRAFGGLALGTVAPAAGTARAQEPKGPVTILVPYGDLVLPVHTALPLATAGQIHLKRWTDVTRQVGIRTIPRPPR